MLQHPCEQRQELTLPCQLQWLQKARKSTGPRRCGHADRFVGAYPARELLRAGPRPDPRDDIRNRFIVLASMVFFSALQTRPMLHEVLIVFFVTLTTLVTLRILVHAALFRDTSENPGGVSEPNGGWCLQKPASNPDIRVITCLQRVALPGYLCPGNAVPAP